jgi:hypothetical protein
MCSVEGSGNSLFILSIGASLFCARMNAAVIASTFGLSPARKTAPWSREQSSIGFADFAWDRSPRS